MIQKAQDAERAFIKDREVFYMDIDTVTPSDVILYPDSGNVRVMAGGMQKTFKMESEVNYLDGE